MKRFVSKLNGVTFFLFKYRRLQIRFPVTSFLNLQQKMIIFGVRTDYIFNASCFQNDLRYDFERSQKNIIFKKKVKTLGIGTKSLIYRFFNIISEK